MIADYTLLKRVENKHAIYKELEEKPFTCGTAWTRYCRTGATFRINQLGAMISLHFAIIPSRLRSGRRPRTMPLPKFFHAMLRRGVYLPPSASRAVSHALDAEDLDASILA